MIVVLMLSAKLIVGFGRTENEGLLLFYIISAELVDSLIRR